MNISGKKIGEVSDDLQELLVPFVLDYPNSDALKLKEQKTLARRCRDLFRRIWSKQLYCTGPSYLVSQWRRRIDYSGDDRYAADNWKCECKKFREATAIMMSCKRSD